MTNTTILQNLRHNFEAHPEDATVETMAFAILFVTNGIDAEFAETIATNWAMKMAEDEKNG